MRATSNIFAFLTAAMLTISGDNVEVFKITQSNDAGDVLVVDSTDPSTAHVNPPEILQINANGGNAFAGSGNRVTLIDVDSEISSGTQTGRLRGVDALLKYSGNAIHSGVSGEEARAFNASTAWNSTGTCSSMVGMQNYIAAGGGAGVTSGLIASGVANQALIGFNSNDAGSYTDAIAFFARSPNNTDLNHTMTNFYGLLIEDAEATGVTNAYAIKTGSGLVDFGGRVQGAQGNDIASANDMTIGTDGNYFDITGTTQINTISIDNVSAGTQITLQFDSNPVVKHNTAGAGASLLLSGSGDFASSANDTLTLMFDGTYWREIGRSVI